MTRRSAFWVVGGLCAVLVACWFRAQRSSSLVPEGGVAAPASMLGAGADSFERATIGPRNADPASAYPHLEIQLVEGSFEPEPAPEFDDLVEHHQSTALWIFTRGEEGPFGEALSRCGAQLEPRLTSSCSYKLRATTVRDSVRPAQANVAHAEIVWPEYQVEEICIELAACELEAWKLRRPAPIDVDLPDVIAFDVQGRGALWRPESGKPIEDWLETVASQNELDVERTLALSNGDPSIPDFNINWNAEVSGRMAREARRTLAFVRGDKWPDEALYEP